MAQKKAEAELFKTVLVQPKVPFGVDPKTIMCVFFKAGVCEKGKFWATNGRPGSGPVLGRTSD